MYKKKEKMRRRREENMDDYEDDILSYEENLREKKLREEYEKKFPSLTETKKSETKQQNQKKK